MRVRRHLTMHSLSSSSSSSSSFTQSSIMRISVYHMQLLIISLTIFYLLSHSYMAQSSSTGGTSSTGGSSGGFNNSSTGITNSSTGNGNNNNTNSSSSSTGPAFTPPSTNAMIQAAWCPIVPIPWEDALSNFTVAVAEFTGSQWCSAGSVDLDFTCIPGTQGLNCPSDREEGRNTDSLYSTNPPKWWRCNYTDPISGNITGGLSVVSPNCFTDSTQCIPRRYMTTINNYNVSGGPQWNGQQFPPYAQFDRPPIAVVLAGAAAVVAEIFYPYIDVLQLLTISNSYNTSFLSLSASTRIVVETIGGTSTTTGTTISPSRSRMNSDCSYVVPFFTLIIDLNHGFVDNVWWQDDGCSLCNPTAYVHSDDGSCNCGVPANECIGFNASATSASGLNTGNSNVNVSCDLSIYIAYSGTDTHGTVLTSSSRTIANFREYSIGALYQSAVNYYNQGIPNIANNLLSGCQTQDAAGNCIQFKTT